MEREYTDDDIRAATRGLNMYRLSIRELSNLRDEHDKRVFASRVIREAASHDRRQDRAHQGACRRLKASTYSQPTPPRPAVAGFFGVYYQ